MVPPRLRTIDIFVDLACAGCPFGARQIAIWSAPNGHLAPARWALGARQIALGGFGLASFGLGPLLQRTHSHTFRYVHQFGTQLSGHKMHHVARCNTAKNWSLFHLAGFWRRYKVETTTWCRKYSQYIAVYPKYTAAYCGVYGRRLRYWRLEYTAVYPRSPKCGSFKHNIYHHNW